MISQLSNITSFNVRERDVDLRKDIHTFTQYVSQRSIKRKTRGNDLPKSDVKRLAKLLSYPHIMKEYDQFTYSPWLSFVDIQALNLGFVSYDLEGEYRGYSSSEPSFTDNYIIYNDDVYQKYLQVDMNTKEHLLLQVLLMPYSYDMNEFFGVSPIGWLDGFARFGIATGVLPTVNFAQVRQFLLQKLGELEVGVWYQTASWVAHFKQEHPHFLIPEKTMREKRGYYYGRKKNEPEYEEIPRYQGFHEEHRGRETIPADAPDAFERVEGRYLERFLEYIPFLLGYVDIAYDPAYDPKPSRYAHRDVSAVDTLKAFRVTPLLRQVLENKLAAPAVTVQPNFDVVIESAVYPVKLLKTFSRLGDVKHQGKTTTVKLDKQAVAAAVAEDDTLDVIATLTAHATRELPQNVVAEIQEWVRRADVFTLYRDLELIEDHIGLPVIKKAAAHHIDERLFLVPASDNIGESLKKDRQIVLVVTHAHQHITQLPDQAQTVFPREADEVLEPETVVVRLESYITLHFPDRAVLDAVRQALLDARCPVTLNTGSTAITFPASYQKTLEDVIESLAEQYIIRIQEV
ncbi:MAG: hypothetical protein AAF653_09115 [Chloroflexota bacterium]